MTFSGTILSAAVLAAMASTALAQPANPFASEPRTSPAAPTTAVAPTEPRAALTTSATLRRFNAGAAELSFSGERVQRDYPFYVTAAETAQAARLVLGYQSAVSIMPETSRMRVFVNDLPVGDTRLASGGNFAMDLPPGTLQPGYNGVRILIDQHHRVDCSIAGTYELWTQIDPSSSGIDFGVPSLELASLADLPAVARTGTERFAINVVHTSDASADLDRAMSVLQSAVVLGGIQRPSVSVSGAQGDGPGLDIVVAANPGAGSIGPLSAAIQLLPDVALVPPDASGRATLLVGAQTTGDIDRTIEGLVQAALSATPLGTASGLKSLSTDRSTNIDTQTPVPLAELGLDTREFAGRFYRSEVSFELPADFYAADYDAARITLDAAYAAGLGRDALLVVQANGRQVASLPLSSSREGQIEQQDLKLPLSTLRPGRNSLTFDATLLNADDAVCDPVSSVNSLKPRFVIGSASTLRLPRIAKMGHLPNIAALTGGGAGSGGTGSSLTLYATGLNAPGVDAAASLVAQIAATSGAVQPITVTGALPVATSGNLLAVGTYADLPHGLLDQVGLDVPSRLGAEAEAEDTLASTTGPVRPGDLMANVRAASLAEAFAAPMDIPARLEELGDRVTGFVRSAVSGGAGLWNNDAFTSGGRHAPDPGSRLVMAQAATPGDRPYAWTVVAASDPAALAQGVQEITVPANWSKLGGAVSILQDDGQMIVHASNGERLYETQARSFSNLRLVFAGWLSRHLQEYVVALLLLALLLGISTRVFLTQVGNKDR